MNISTIALGLFFPVGVITLVMIYIQWRIVKFWKEQTRDRKPASLTDAITQRQEMIKWFDWFNNTQKAAMKRAGNMSWMDMAKQSTQRDPRYRALQYNKKAIEKMAKSLEFSYKYMFPAMNWLAKFGLYIVYVLIVILVILILLRIFG